MDSNPPVASDTGPPPTAAELHPDAIALAGRFFDAARSGQMEGFEEALERGLPVNLTNDKGDTLVSYCNFVACCRQCCTEEGSRHVSV